MAALTEASSTHQLSKRPKIFAQNGRVKYSRAFHQYVIGFQIKYYLIADRAAAAEFNNSFQRLDNLTKTEDYLADIYMKIWSISNQF